MNQVIRITKHSGPAKRVVSWSSLDWTHKPRWLQLDLVGGTVFDIIVHTVSAYFLAELLETRQVRGIYFKSVDILI